MRPAASLHLQLLLQLLLLTHLVAASEDDTMMSIGSGHSNRLVHSRPRQIRGSWKAANHWCRSRGRGGLAQLLGESDDGGMEKLATRTRHLSTAGCYWVELAATASMDELRWLVDNPQHGDNGCLCVKADGNGRSGRHHRASKPRLHLARCSQRLPFLCQRPLVAPTGGRGVKKPQQLHPVKKPQQLHPVKKDHRPTATAVTKKPASVELISDSQEVNDSEDVDSQEDHGKIPKFIEGKGILNPWPTTNAAAAAAPSTSGKSLEGNWTTATTTDSWHREDGNLMTSSQRSEFVTLLVLYSIVGVVCLVLVALCLINCLRNCCGGRSRVRYIKHVDEDDIPRFMPSSWA